MDHNNGMVYQNREMLNNMDQSSYTDSKDTVSMETTNLEPYDGCVILGKKEFGQAYYATRFYIDHSQRASSTTSSPTSSSSTTQYSSQGVCCPFAHPTSTNLTCCGATWSVIYSEFFLFTCHLIVLILGTVKEVLYMRQWDGYLHLVLSVLENGICLIVIVIRIASVCYRYYSLRYIVKLNEHIVAQDVYGSSLRRSLVSFILLSVFMFLIVSGSFAALYLLAHLGWTVMITNFTLLIMYIAFLLFIQNLDLAITQIQNDEHKAIIHEAVLLLREGRFAVSMEQKLAHYRQTECFITALRYSPFLAQSHHISIIPGFNPETLALKQMESTV